METEWKVVGRKENGKLVSARAPGWLEVEYEIGRTVYPPIGYLFGFDSLRAALAFAFSTTRWVILKGEGEVIRPHNINKILSLGGLYHRKLVKAFWRKPREGTPGRFPMPHGTVFLSSFRPDLVCASWAKK